MMPFLHFYMVILLSKCSLNYLNKNDWYYGKFHFVMDIAGFRFCIPVSVVNFGYAHLASHF
jgi:hypothetical protein